MPAKTGKEYIDRVNQIQTNVWMDGKKISGKISDHPAFHGMINSQAALYEMQHETGKKNKMTYRSPTTGKPVGMSFLEPKTKEDLEKRRIMIQEWARYHQGMMGRSPDYMNTTIMTFGAAADLFASQDAAFGKNMRSYYEYCREHDISLTHTFVQPQVNRSAMAIESEDEIIAARIVDENDDGIVIQGARLLATQGGSTDEIMVFPSGGNVLHVSEDYPYAYAFCIPNDTPGLKYICRESFHYGGKSNWDHPLASRFEEVDTIVVFDRVVVPWNRVFIYRDNQLATQLFSDTSFFEHASHQSVCRNVVKTEFILGLLQSIVDSINISEYQHIQEKMAEVMIALETMKGFLYSSEQNAQIDRWGTMTPAKTPLLAAVNYYPRMYPRLTEILQIFGASGLISIPSEADFQSEIRGDLDKYMQSAGDNAHDRVKLFRLAWDTAMSAFGSRQIQYERFFFGDPVRLASRLYKETDRTEYVDRVKTFLNGPDE